MVCLTIHQLGQGCFQFLTIINKTAINIKKRIFLWASLTGNMKEGEYWEMQFSLAKSTNDKPTKIPCFLKK